MQQGPACQGSWSVAVAESSQDKIKDVIAEFHADEVRAGPLLFANNILTKKFSISRHQIKHILALYPLTL